MPHSLHVFCLAQNKNKNRIQTTFDWVLELNDAERALMISTPSVIVLTEYSKHCCPYSPCHVVKVAEV
jgi:hypothetical protein